MMAPMCMFSAGPDGKVTDWHYVHYSTRAAGGTGLIILEATGVEPRGRITVNDLGIWSDDHIEGLKKIVDSCHSLGAKVGIQLAHAGRKSATTEEAIIAPSAIPFSDDYKTPVAMEEKDIEAVIKAFAEGARRAHEAGFDVIELHGAHGYLLNEFLSPLTNKRADQYGGTLENRARFLKDVLGAVRREWPLEKPIILRVSAEDYVEEGNHPEDLAQIINMVKDLGIEAINVSSGAVVDAVPTVYPGYQLAMATHIKEQTQLPVIGGGLITTPELGEEAIRNGKLDMIFLGRELLRNPYWPMEAAHKLKEEHQWPVQYERGKWRS